MLKSNAVILQPNIDVYYAFNAGDTYKHRAFRGQPSTVQSQYSSQAAIINAKMAMLPVLRDPSKVSNPETGKLTVLVSAYNVHAEEKGL